MKKSIYALIMLLSGVVIILAWFIMVVVQTPHNFNFLKRGEMNLIETKNFFLDKDSTLDITGYDCNIQFLQGDTKEIEIKEYASKKYGDTSFTAVEQTDQTMYILASKPNQFANFGLIRQLYQQRSMTISLPKDFSGKLRLTTTSGDVNAKLELDLEDVLLQTSSGDINANTITSPFHEIKTVSGNINIQALDGEKTLATSSGYIRINKVTEATTATSISGDITLKDANHQLDIKTSSGKIKVSGGNTFCRFTSISGDINAEHLSGEVHAKTSSGYINLESITGHGSFHSISGDIKLSFMELTDNLDISSTSGYISCHIPKANEFDFNASTNSGDIRTYFDESLSYSNRKNNASNHQQSPISITVKTTSGDIKIDD